MHVKTIQTALAWSCWSVILWAHRLHVCCCYTTDCRASRGPHESRRQEEIQALKLSSKFTQAHTQYRLCPAPTSLMTSLENNKSTAWLIQTQSHAATAPLSRVCYILHVWHINKILSNPAESCLCNSHRVSSAGVAWQHTVTHTEIKSWYSSGLVWGADLSKNQAAYLNSGIILNQIRELPRRSDNKAARNFDGAPDYQTVAQYKTHEWNTRVTTWCLREEPAHLRASQEVVELDPADGGVGLEVGELVSQQDSRHGGLLSAAQTREKEGRQERGGGPLPWQACSYRQLINEPGWGRG